MSSRPIGEYTGERHAENRMVQSFVPSSIGLQSYGPQVRRATLSGSHVSRCIQLLEACPNARFSLVGDFSRSSLDLFRADAPRIHGSLRFICDGLGDTEVEKLKSCMQELDSLTEISIGLGNKRECSRGSQSCSAGNSYQSYRYSQRSYHLKNATRYADDSQALHSLCRSQR